MRIRDTYRHLSATVGAQAELVGIRIARRAFRMKFQRELREDEALATLRALGDDGRHLRQAVALAAVGATDEQVEGVMRAIARGEVEA